MMKQQSIAISSASLSASMLSLIAIISITVLFSSTLRGESVTHLFDRANNLYFKGQYKSAIKTYYKIMNLGIEAPALYFNTANAFARLGEYGKAIYFYEKVLKIKPRDVAAQRNLAIIRKTVAKKISRRFRNADLRPKESVWESGVSWFTSNELAIIFLIFYYFFFTALVMKKILKRQVAKIAMTISTFFFLALWIVAGSMLATKYKMDFLTKEGIVLQSGLVAVREGPTNEANRLFDVMEGQRVKIKEERGRWVKIQDDRGRNGWIEESEIGTL